MSNSTLVSYAKDSPNNSGKRTVPIDRITPHCVVGQCAIEALGNLFADPARRASSNYGIDRDGRVGLFVDEDCVSWCSGGDLYREKIANDAHAVTIECASDLTAPWAFRPVVYDKLVELCADICRRNGKNRLLWLEDRDRTLAYVPQQNEMVLTVHRWFANKACPGDWMMQRMGDLAERVTAALEPSQSALQAAPPEGEPSTSALSDAPGGTPQPWYAEAMQWARERRIINDGRPNDPVTRAELATVLRRIMGPEDTKTDSGLLSE